MELRAGLWDFGTQLHNADQLILLEKGEKKIFTAPVRYDCIGINGS